MADHDEGGDRKPLKDNGRKDFKPKDAARDGFAPRGAKGTEHLTPGAPGLGGSRRPQSRDQSLSQGRGQETPDSRPLAPKTGDREVDAHYGKDHRLVDPDKLSAKGDKGKEATNEKSAGPSKPSAQDIFNKMSRDRSRDKDRGF